MVRFLIADSCPATVYGTKRFVQSVSKDEVVVGEAGSVEEILRLISDLCPDKIVLAPRFDATAPDPIEEAALCRFLKSLPKMPSVIIYSTHDSPAEVALLARAGADHYIHKNTSLEGLREAWERDQAGESVWMVGSHSESAMPHLFGMLERMQLTTRQLEVLALLLRRYSDAQIAKKLHITLQTAKNHNMNIFRKLSVNSRQGLQDKFVM